MPPTELLVSVVWLVTPAVAAGVARWTATGSCRASLLLTAGLPEEEPDAINERERGSERLEDDDAGDPSPCVVVEDCFE